MVDGPQLGENVGRRELLRAIVPLPAQMFTGAGAPEVKG
jgi:hypothetical protein